ncbi:MAG TPA: hypothetical protein GXX40_06420 [Firmicutes bacterium]|nr:hypothetical protein [Bacillota bacterium]
MANLVLGVILLLLPVAPTSVTLGIGLVGGLVLAYTNREQLKADIRGTPLSIFALWLVVPLIASVLFKQSIIFMGIWMACFAGYFVGRRAAASEMLTESVWTVPLAAIPVSALAIYQVWAGVQTPIAWIDNEMADIIKTRAYSTFDNPTMLADYLALTIPITLALLWNASPFRRVWGAGSLALQCTALVFTFSRGAWVATAGELLLMAAVLMPRFLWVAASAIVVFVLFGPKSVTVRALSVFTGGDSTTKYRLTIWKAGWQMVRDYWVTGVGLGAPAFSRVYVGYEIAGTPAMHTHNLFMQLLVEIGLPGLILFTWYCLDLFYNGYRQLRRHTLNARLQPLFIALLAGLAGQLGHGLFDHIWYTPKNMLFFWCGAGILSGLMALTGGDNK